MKKSLPKTWKNGKTARNISYLEKKTQKPLKKLYRNCIIYVYPAYKLAIPLVTDTNLRSTPSTRFHKGY